MKKVICILSALAVLLCFWLIALWMPALTDGDKPQDETRFGVSEGLELVEQTYDGREKKYIVEDDKGNVVFTVPLRGCIIDTRYRDGKLRFREQDSGREGYIDCQGIITFLNDGKVNIPEQVTTGTTARFATSDMTSARQQYSRASASSPDVGTLKSSVAGRMNQTISQVELKSIVKNDAFYKEASKILHGKLTEQDARCRHTILNYCEHLRTAYTTKDIDFLRQVFSDKALIIVGNVVKTAATDGKCIAEPRVTYAIHTKQEYLSRLAKVFSLNSKIDVKFSGFRILRHPTMDGIYGVTLRQRYKSDRYCDDGYLFLLWDFRDKSMPLIHVRTWQPASSVAAGADVISMQDFNLQ